MNAVENATTTIFDRNPIATIRYLYKKYGYIQEMQIAERREFSKDAVRELDFFHSLIENFEEKLCDADRQIVGAFHPLWKSEGANEFLARKEK